MQHEVEKLGKELKDLSNKEHLRLFFFECLSCLDNISYEMSQNFEPDYYAAYLLDIDLSVEKNDGATISLDKPVSANACLDVILKRELLDNQHPKRTFRLPGVMFVSDDIFQNMKLINELKDLIKKSITRTNILTKRERGKFAQSMYHGRSTLSLVELYRKVVLINDPLESVAFTWGVKVPQIKTYTRDELLLALEELKHPDRSYSWNYGLDKDIALVESQPSYAKFRTRRDIPPHPRVNLKFCKPITVEHNGVKRETDRLQKHGHLPIIVHSGTSDFSSVDITGLRSSSAVFEREGRPDIISDYQAFPVLRGFMPMYMKVD